MSGQSRKAAYHTCTVHANAAARLSPMHSAHKCCSKMVCAVAWRMHRVYNCASKRAKSSYSYADTCACTHMACNNPSCLSRLVFISCTRQCKTFGKVQKCMIALSQVHATSVKSGVCLEAIDKIQPLIARFWWNAQAGRFCKCHIVNQPCVSSDSRMLL